MPLLDNTELSEELDGRLENLSDHLVSCLSGVARPVIFETGSPIINSGELATNIYAISAGIARVFKQRPAGRRQFTGLLYAGDFIGVNSRQRYIFGVEAATTVSALAFSRRDVDRLVHQYPEIERVFLSGAFNELDLAQDRMLVINREEECERIAAYLLLLCRRQPLGFEDPKSKIIIPLSVDEIAEYLGLEPETVSRWLKRFVHEGIIRTVRGWREIEIVRWSKLLTLSYRVSV